MPERKQLNLLIEKEQKDRWKDYVDSSGKYTSLSGLIRTAVESEIKEADQDPESSLSPAINRDIQDLRDEISEVRKDVRWLRKNQQDDVDISELAQNVYDELRVLPEPEGPVTVPESVDMSSDEYSNLLRAQLVIEPESQEESEQIGRRPQTAEAIAERLDSSAKRVEDAIEHLSDQFLPVVEVEYQNERHWFKEE